MTFIYSAFLFIFTIYSFALVDPNLTLISSNWWEFFRGKMVLLGYYRRDLSWLIYFAILILLFVFNYFFIKKYKRFNATKLAIFIGLALLFSYPFLSHDFFNYLFDAKIVTFYHKNPYFYSALDFPTDPWIRFMHWTHRTYPYGPVFLLITLFPSLLSLGKFFLSFLFFKLAFALFYILAVYFLEKIDKKHAIIFATSPLIIIEGLINSHNDLIAVSLGIVGVYYLINRQTLRAQIFFLLSLGIKFITFPILFLAKKSKTRNKLIFTALIGIVIYLSIKSEIQPWYFLNLFIFLPFFDQIIGKLNILFLGLLLSYYPYIRLGGWDTIEKINLKHWIIIVFFIVNVLYIFFLKFNPLKRVKKNN